MSNYTGDDIDAIYQASQIACLEKIKRLNLCLIPPANESEGWMGSKDAVVVFNGYDTKQVVHRINAMIQSIPTARHMNDTAAGQPDDKPAENPATDKKEFPPYTFTKIDEVNNVWGVRAMETPGQESQEGKTVDVSKKGKYGNVLVSAKLGKRVSEYKLYGGNRGYVIYEQRE